MASKVSIELDLEVVQKAVHAKVQPAVDAILATCDLSKRIETELLKKPEKGDDSLRELWAMRHIFGRTAADGRPLIDQLVSQAISDAAQDFIKKSIKKERPKIEAAFTKMLRDSPNALAKTLANSLDEALTSEWAFTMETKVSAKEPPRSYDD